MTRSNTGGDDGDESVPEWLIKKYEEQTKSE
nr:MAG TPA: hypothetical protein [Caudoviricetes sp.]